MSTFNLEDWQPAVPVTLADGLTEEQLLKFPAFKNWIGTFKKSLEQQSKKDHPFHHEPYQLKSIEVQAVDYFGGGRVGFIKMKTEVKNENGERFPGSFLLRGGSVGMLVILQPDDVSPTSEQDKHVILTLQPRIPAGSLAFAEIPAGMLDDSGSFAGGAAKELQEEVGLEIKQDELIDMTSLALEDDPQEQSGEALHKAMYPSAGGCDEFIPIFLYQKQIPRSQLQDWQGKLTGLRDHGEKITLKVVRLEDVWREGARDAKALAALALYQGLRGAGKLPEKGKASL
ncbi:nudix hydrolase 14 [Elsinoe ampelina]|uniref:Nudix hydrolase 14 n=1 Tax=Elsinoe ampelina TaxID=302913 RepID=A0A6A6G360_9PEZI|nr:nudix hydrolase 14 [Elsinoe ampelina]